MNPLVREVGQLAKHADDALEAVMRRVDGLTLPDAGLTAEHLCEVIDAVAAMLVPMVERVEQIGEREQEVWAQDRAVYLVEESAMALELGRNGLLVARYALGNGRAHLLTVERGEDV